ncbi:MAG: hypothetical protein N3E37_05080, partial [Candidatus Micrarchaeota archaeon]|nr:hypothetical protein [Candidatus Micrarchaeota archaeon]
MVYSNIITLVILGIICIALLILSYGYIESNFSSLVESLRMKESIRYAQAEHRKIEIKSVIPSGTCSIGHYILIKAINNGNVQVSLDRLSIVVNGKVVEHSAKGVWNPGTDIEINVTSPIVSSGSDLDRLTITTDSGAQIYYSYNCSELICSSDSLFSVWDYNSTFAGQDTKFFIRFFDGDIVKSYRFLFDNCTGYYEDITGWIDVDQLFGEATQVLRLNDTIGCTIKARIEVKDRCDNLAFSETSFETNELLCFHDAFSIADWKWNSTLVDSWSNLSINITDMDGLHSYVFGFDNGTGNYEFEPVRYVNGGKYLNFSRVVKLNPLEGSLIR